MAKKKTGHGKATMFSMRLHPLLKSGLEDLANRNLSTVSAEIVAAIRKHLQDHGLWPPPVKASAERRK